MLLLILNSCRSPREDLHVLKNRMPADLFDQAEVFDTGALDTMPDIPRVIALLTSEKEKDADLIRELLKEESITDMEVLSGELVVEPQMENSEITLDYASELYGCTASELITIDQSIDELAKKLQRIITTKSSVYPLGEAFEMWCYPQ